ncbi:MAG: PH domain-containing protein [Lachnospiraceae bacterium]|nr:PH domain-containing protein [Lachnospiraceae bacterium]
MPKNKRPPVPKERPSNEIIWTDKKRLWCGLPWTFTRYSLSADRLFIKRGILTIREDEVRLYRIRDISLRQSFLQRIFGLGTINISSSDSTMGNFQLINIKNSRDVKEMLSDTVEIERERKRVSMREFVGYGEMDGMDDTDFDNFDDQ